MIRLPTLSTPVVALALLVISTGQGSRQAWGAIVPGSLPPEAAPRGPDLPEREEQRIRESAGLPLGVVPGPGPTARPGVVAPRRLEAGGPVRIQSREDAAAVAMRGTGSAEDPYVISDLVLDGLGSAEPFGFFWSDPHATYHVSLRNVRITGWAGAQIYVRTGASLDVRHAEVRGADASGAAGFRIAGGEVTIAETILTALAGDGVQVVGDAPVRATLTDCRFDESGGAWGARARAVHNLNGGGRVSITIRRCDFDAPSIDAAVRPWRAATIELDRSRFATRTGIQGRDGSELRLTARACLFVTEREAIDGVSLRDWEVAYCEFRDNEAGHPLVRIARSAGGTVHHSLFTKTTGNGPDDGCVEAVDCLDLRLAYNWISASPATAFVLARVGGSSRVHHTVGDGVRDRLVTWSGPAPGTRTIHDLCANHGEVPDSRLTAALAPGIPGPG